MYTMKKIIRSESGVIENTRRRKETIAIIFQDSEEDPTYNSVKKTT